MAASEELLAAAASEELLAAVTSVELLVAMSEELVATAAVDGNTRGTERLVGTRRVIAPLQKLGRVVL